MANHTYIIAEAGVNHNGSLELAKELIIKAAEAGADAVKFQTFRAEKLASGSAPKAAYQMETTDASESQIAMLKKLELKESDYPALIKLAEEHHIDFISTPFEVDSLHFLIDDCHLPLIKIPSGEITNAPFLLDAARCDMPIIMSTGMATLGEVEAALSVLAYGYTHGHDECPTSQRDFVDAYASDEGQAQLRRNVRLLHCTTEYPAPFDEVNLRAMDTMREAFGLTVGYSDHTEGIAVPIAAVARGACIIEKHFTLDKNMEGPDHKASLEPDELKAMVAAIRQIEKSLGSGIKYPSEREKKNIDIVRKSLVAAKAIKKGETFTSENLATKRPGSGVSPMMYWDLIGKKAEKEYRVDELIK